MKTFKKFCASNDTIHRVKMKPPEWKNIFSNQASDRRLVSRLYRELLKLNKKQPDLKKKMGKGL